MTSFGKYRIYRWFAPALIFAYFAVVIVGMSVFHESELFPFFNWSLFSASFAERTSDTIRIDSVDGNPLRASRLYYEMTETFSHARDRDINVSKTIERLVRAIQEQDGLTISQMRKLIEDRYMAEVKAAEYNVIVLTYDPIRRLRFGEIKDAVVLATYRKGAP